MAPDNSNNNSSDHDGNQQGPALEELRRNARASFWRCAKDSFSKLVLTEAPLVWKDPREARYYRAEKQIVAEHLEPLKQGLYISIFLLVTFRVTGSKWFSQVRHKYGINLSAAAPKEEGAEAVKAAAPTPPPPSNARNPQAAQAHAKFKSFSEQQAEKAQGAFTDATSFTTDILLSIMCGLSSTVLLLDRPKMANDVARIPLVPGKSVIYNTVCSDMTTAYENTSRLVWEQQQQQQQDLGETTNDLTLDTFHTFVQNCRIRSEYLQLKGVEQQSPRGENGQGKGTVRLRDDSSGEIVPPPGLYELADAPER